MQNKLLQSEKLDKKTKQRFLGSFSGQTLTVAPGTRCTPKYQEPAVPEPDDRSQTAIPTRDQELGKVRNVAQIRRIQRRIRARNRRKSKGFRKEGEKSKEMKRTHRSREGLARGGGGGGERSVLRRRQRWEEAESPQRRIGTPLGAEDEKGTARAATAARHLADSSLQSPDKALRRNNNNVHSCTFELFFLTNVKA